MKYNVEIYGNDLKSLLILKSLRQSGFQACIFSDARFNFDTSYEFENQKFDCGYHAVEIGRSHEVWNLIKSEPIKFNELTAKRYLYLDGKVLPRNYSLSKLGNSTLSELYEKNSSEAYEYFVESYVENKFIASYAQNVILRDIFNLQSADYLVNIRPWLYPKEFLQYVETEISYHFEKSDNNDKKIAYPTEAGFGKIQESLRRSLGDYIYQSPQHWALADSDDVLSRLNYHAENNKAIYVIPIDLWKLISRSKFVPKRKKTTYAIIDLELDCEIDLNWTELLVADNNILIDRISSPEILSGAAKTRFLQIEKELDAAQECSDFEKKIINDLEILLSSIFKKVKVKNYQVKTVPFYRFHNDECFKAVDNLIETIESNYKNIIVLNRSLFYRNFVDTFENLKSAINRKLQS